jgi:hypothetical protein
MFCSIRYRTAGAVCGSNTRDLRGKTGHRLDPVGHLPRRNAGEPKLAEVCLKGMTPTVQHSAEAATQELVMRGT